MSDTLGPLMERNLLDIFGQSDRARRAVAIADIYTPNCTFFEAGGTRRRPRRSQREDRTHSQGSSRICVSRDSAR
ncbi:hypothetical protein [Bradyrhizobium rifense]|uniref:hypothetical protein n=1 Tax=Bradyrhizobium rifense TaxID=515499 RepID=UPI001AEED8CA|nr:hypothetical protein [Bradyrhizobium rifense]